MFRLIDMTEINEHLQNDSNDPLGDAKVAGHFLDHDSILGRWIYLIQPSDSKILMDDVLLYEVFF